MSTSILTRWRKAFTTDADGNDALRTVISGDQNLGGGYITNEQITTNMMSKGTVYRFDGVDDNVTVTDSAEIQNIFANGGFVSADIYPLSDGELDAGRILSKQAAGAGWLINTKNEAGGLLSISFSREAATTDGVWIASAVVPINKESIITVSYNDSTPTVAPVFYVNGVVATVSSAIPPVGALGTDAGTDLTIGNNSTGVVTFDGSIGEVMLGNFVPTASEIKDLISGNLPYKWQYGSQTELNTDANSTSDNAGAEADATTGWTVGNQAGNTFESQGVTVQDGSFAFHITADVSPQNVLRIYKNIETDWGLVSGKKYRISAWIAHDGTGTGDAGWVIGLGASDNGDGFTAGYFENVISSETTFKQVEFDFVHSSLTKYLVVRENSPSNDGGVYFDNLSCIALGAVAHYTQDSISETYWYDKANGNDGAVTGAEVLNQPSVTPLFAIHSNTFRLEPGATPGTNINVTELDVSNWNPEAVTDATNLAKSGSSGSFALDASGAVLTFYPAKEVVGIIAYGVRKHDINSSSTTEMYFPSGKPSGGNLQINLFKRAAASAIDLTTVLDAGDSYDFFVTYITAT